MEANDPVLHTLPGKPGVYIMKNAEGVPIYIGKAKNLKKRVHSYFNDQDTRYLVQVFRPLIHRIEWVVTASETDAFILENRLIKAHQPRYNIKLKDDKSEFCLRIDTRHPFPRIESVHLHQRREEPGVLYFGPYVSSRSVRRTLDLLQRCFPLRTCSDTVFRTARRPCLESDMGRCPCPCTGEVTREDYRRVLDQAVDFLRGKNRSVLNALRAERARAARQLHYEEAAALHRQVQAIEDTLETQSVVTALRRDLDALACARDPETGRAAVECVLVRGGAVMDLAGASLENTHAYAGDEELLGDFLLARYAASGRAVPPLVLFPASCPVPAGLGPALTAARGSRVRVRRPRGAEEDRLCRLAAENAASLLERAGSAWTRMQELQEKLRLARLPRAMACLDISHQAGGCAYGSMVRFSDLEPDKAGYRVFALEGGGFDDLASMRKTLQRALDHLKDNLPDLLLIDGGRNQLAAAVEILARGEARGRVDVASVVKSASGRDRILLPGGGQVRDELSNGAYQALVHIRDEAHRFAIKHSRGGLLRKTVTSRFDGVPGLGPVRAARLIKTFGSPEAVGRASLEELRTSRVLPGPVCETLYRSLHESS